MSTEYIPRLRDRELDEFIEQETPHKDVLLVDGARQVGKTSLVKQALARSSRRTSFRSSRRTRPPWRRRWSPLSAWGRLSMNATPAKPRTL